MPTTAAAAKKLAELGTQLLERYAAAKDGATHLQAAGKTKGKKTATKKRTKAAKKAKRKKATTPAPAVKKPQRKKKTVAAKAKRKKTATRRQSRKAKPGLYANIHKAQKRAARGGRPVRKKGEAGAPSEQALKKAAKTAH